MRYVILIIVMMSSNASIACKLEGKWKSNKSKTLSELYGSALNNRQKMALSKIFGKSIAEYRDCNTLILEFEGKKTESSFEVIGESSEQVTVRYISDGEITKIRLEGDCYSVPIKGLGINEYFCRM